MTSSDVDHDELFRRPAEGECPLPQVVLEHGGLGGIEQLAQSALPEVKISVTGLMRRSSLGDAAVFIAAHPPAPASALVASRLQLRRRPAR
jgi:hypothetical protein